MWKCKEWDAVNFIVNQFINKLKQLHVEIYQNETSWCFPTVLFSVICCHCRFLLWLKNYMWIEVRDKKFGNSSGLHFFMSEIFDQCQWKLRQESHALAIKEND